MRPLYILFFILFVNTLQAQNPTVIGDSMLCPNSTGMVSTQPYDTYQWFLRYFGSSTITPISGANSQFLPIDYATYAGAYLSVEVTLGANDYISPEFFVDGWVFAGMTVASSGNYTIGPLGEFILCQGDTMYFEVMLPYDTTITWYKNGDTIPGITSQIFTVTEPGVYYVTAAPTLCPSYVEGPGVDLTVLDCSVGVDENSKHGSITGYPNPTSGKVKIAGISANEQFTLTDIQGRIVMTRIFKGLETQIDLENMEAGIYFLRAGSAKTMIVRQ